MVKAYLGIGEKKQDECQDFGEFMNAVQEGGFNINGS
jgi:hypothetical protein